MPCWATHDQAAEATRKSGLGAAPAGTQLMFGGFWATAADGFRFTSPRILRPEPGIQVAQGYDFADLAFITTSGGVVAIDAGTTQDRVKAALGDLDPPADSAISHLILTHAHWDHIGGAGALRGPGTRVIAQAGFPAGLDRQQGDRPRFRYFTGAAGDIPPAVVPDQLISQPTPLTVGGTELVLYPAPGGETPDALMVHLPASGVLFAGDVLMPYLGQPFAAEGSPDGLLQALAFIASLRPRLLIHGHATLTEQFTAGAVPGLQAALTQLHGQVLDGIRDGRTLPDILADASLPAVLRDHPTAVVPYLVTRDHFTERLYHQRTGYWQPDGTGLEPATAAGHAAALDLLAGGRDEQFTAAATTLISQGDHALALQIIQPGLLRHPASSTLARLRRTALHRLMEQHQQTRPVQVPHLRRTRRRRDRPRPVAARRTLAPDRQGTAKETTMHNDSSRNSDEAGHDAPGPGLRVRPPAHPVAAQAVGPDAARETGVVTKLPEGRGSAGLTERLAAASARRARRVLAAEVRK